MIAKVAIILATFTAGFFLHAGLAPDRSMVWEVKVEDDAPVCWKVEGRTFAGPLSWADGHTDNIIAC